MYGFWETHQPNAKEPCTSLQFDIREANYSTINAQIGSYFSGDIFNYYFDNTTHELSDAVFGVMACTTTAEVKEYLLNAMTDIC